MSDQALARLRAPDSPHLQQLVEMICASILAQPLRELIDPTHLATHTAEAVRTLTSTESRAVVHRRLLEGLERHASETGTLRPRLPQAAIAPVQQLLGRPVHASEALTFRLIDQGVVHALLGEILESALRRFARRAKRVDDRIKAVDERLGGFGKRARGLFGNVASELAHAVGDELEQSVERRIREFVHQGTSEMLKVAARRLADPGQAAAWGEFRVAVLDVVLDTPAGDWVSEIRAQDPEGALDEVLDVLAAAALEDEFVRDAADATERLLDTVGDGSIGAWLDELGLRQTWSDAVAGPMHAQASALVHGDAFGAWWKALHTD